MKCEVCIEVSCLFLWALDWWTHYGYGNKGLGIVPGELHKHLSLTGVGEDFRDQRGALIFGEGRTEQLLPEWILATREKVVGWRTM